MKKTLLFISLIALFSLNINAQSIKLLKEDGSAIVDNYLVVSVDNSNALVEVPIYVKNLTGSNLEVMVKKYELDLVTDTEAYFCWDICYPNTAFVSTAFITASANDTIKDFSGDYKTAGNMGISKVMYTFFKNKEATDSASVTIEYHIVGVGINDIDAINQSISCYPNPVNDNLFFEYNLEPNSKGEILIFDLTGRKVKQENITSSETNLQINVSDLNAGIYLWTIEVDGIPIKSEKLIKR
jgi:Secretion system C-terminal sorting domain